MAVDTKELIAEAVKRLLMQKKVKKLTVKDIVDECSITRQTFYYHFEDIPDLLKWVLERGTDRMIEETLTQGDAEKGLRCLFLLADGGGTVFHIFPAGGGKTRPVRSMQPCGLETCDALPQSGGPRPPQKLDRGRQRRFRPHRSHCPSACCGGDLPQTITLSSHRMPECRTFYTPAFLSIHASFSGYCSSLPP